MAPECSSPPLRVTDGSTRNRSFDIAAAAVWLEGEGGAAAYEAAGVAGLKSKLEWLTGAGGVAGSADAAGDDAAAGALDEPTATVSVVVVVLELAAVDEVELVEDELVEADEDDPTGPVPASIFAITGAAVPVVAPVPVIGPGATPG